MTATLGRCAHLQLATILASFYCQWHVQAFAVFHSIRIFFSVQKYIVKWYNLKLNDTKSEEKARPLITISLHCSCSFQSGRTCRCLRRVCHLIARFFPINYLQPNFYAHVNASLPFIPRTITSAGAKNEIKMHYSCSLLLLQSIRGAHAFHHFNFTVLGIRNVKTITKCWGISRATWSRKITYQILIVPYYQSHYRNNILYHSSNSKLYDSVNSSDNLTQFSPAHSKRRVRISSKLVGHFVLARKCQ